MKKLLLFVLTAFISLQNSHSQSDIIGKIITSEEKPMEFVNVLLYNNQDSSFLKGAITDTAGLYQFDDVAEGDYYIEASMVGFGSGKTAAFNHDGQERTLTEVLQLSDGIELSEVVVTATKPFIELRADKIVVNVSNSSVAAGNNALEVLQKSPGVAVDKDNNISLKGKQGVLVMLDGKNQYMSNEDIARLLETMPASNIESIEIIQNPSAKYDAEGNSGIINIRLKKNENLGYNGSITVAGRQGRHTNYNGSMTLNFRSSKANVYGNLSRYHWKGFNDISLYRDIPFNNGNTIFDQNSLMGWNGNSNDLKLGVDYFLNDKTTIGLLAKRNFGDRYFGNNNSTTISGDNSPAYDVLEVDTGNEGEWTQQSYNANIKRELNDKGSAIVLDVDYSMYDNPEFALYRNLYLDQNGNEILNPGFRRNNQGVDINIFATKLDYNVTLGKFNLELGGKFSSVETDNATIFEDQIDSEWIQNGGLTNQFIYEEDIYATYVNGSTQLGKVNLQLGLRMEHTNSDGHSVTLDERVIRECTNLFPSVSLSHILGEKHSLSYTFSRRLNRPNYRNLNPFVEYLDDYTFQKGNPFLQPQYSNSFGINYGYGRSLFVSANYSKTSEAITEVLEQVSEENTTFQTVQNLDDFESFNFNVTAPIVINQQWTTRLSGTGFYHKFTSAIPSGTLDNSQFSYNLYVSNDIHLPKGWRAEVTANYRSSLIWGLFEIDPQWNLDLGFSTRVMDGKGSIKVGLSDVFRTLINNVNVQQDDLNVTVNQFRDSRRATVSFSYKFGNQKVKQARKRRTATEDEAGRITRDNG